MLEIGDPSSDADVLELVEHLVDPAAKLRLVGADLALGKLRMTWANSSAPTVGLGAAAAVGIALRGEQRAAPSRRGCRSCAPRRSPGRIPW